MHLQEARIVTLDFETTGVEVSKDKIVQAAFEVREPGKESILYKFLVNPGKPIPKEASDVHGITDELVANERKFDGHMARWIFDLLNVPNTVIVGFNLLSFDIPLLSQEMYRAGEELPKNMVIIDAGNIFKKMEPRTLSAAVKLYLGREADGAHDAGVDVVNTTEVLFRQIEVYSDLPKTVGELSAFSKFNDNVDIAGFIILDGNGDEVFAKGKHKGKKVADMPDYGRWMLSADFTYDTKSHVKRILTAAGHNVY